MNRNFFYLAVCLVLSLTLLPMKQAQAGNADNCRAPILPWSATMETQITQNLPVGTVIPGSDTSTVVTITCTAAWVKDQAYCDGGSGWAVNLVGAVPLETDVQGAYTFSGMPGGVAYQFLGEDGQPLRLDTTSRHDTGVPIRTGEQNVPLRFRMVRISGALSPGTFTIRMQLSCNGSEWANRNGTYSALSIVVNAQVIAETCSLTTPSIQLNLREVSRPDFKGVGSAAGATPLSLVFQCDAYANARFNFSDVTDLANASDVLKLRTGSTARNVGVRLMHQGEPVHLARNQMFDQGGSDFPLHNSEASQNLINLSFTAEYVQTGVPVAAGNVQAQAIVTIDYN